MSLYINNLKSILAASKKHKKNQSVSQKYRQFNWLFLATALSPMLLVGGFNIFIDPYGVYNSLLVDGLNQAKPRKMENDRLFKAIDIIRIKPITVLLGSSRMRQGIDPKNAALKAYQPAYNLGLNGVNINEELNYLKHALYNQPNLKLVIFGVDFFMFNDLIKQQSAFNKQRLSTNYIIPQDILNTSFSIDALVASQETIQDSFKNRHDYKSVNYGKDGFMPYRNINPKTTLWRFKSNINDYFENHNHYKLSQKYLEDLKKIVELCQQHGIELKVFISPSHATQWEAIRATGHWQTFENWKREIVKIVPVWDFSGYNSITAEPITNDIKNYTDNSHYMPKIGTLILNKILGYQTQVVPQDFGILITPENVEQHIEQIRRDRQAWAQKHLQEVQLVQEVKRAYDASQINY
jgi:hypothetical protein